MKLLSSQRPSMACALTALTIVLSPINSPVSFASESQSQIGNQIPVATTTSQGHSPLSCIPGQAWQWAYGPEVTDLAIQAQEALGGNGITATVTARSFGEIDNCGAYSPFSVDLTIDIRSVAMHSDSASLTNRQTMDGIRASLRSALNERLGNVRVRFPDGTEAVTRDMTSTQSMETLAMETLAPASTPTIWQSAATSTTPPGRYTHGMAFDTHRGVAVVFGGDGTGSSRLSDTWEYDGTGWRQVSASPSPPGRVNIDQTLVYDAVRRKIILFGGLGTSTYYNDTWEYNGANWSQVSTSLSPPARDSHAMVFDSHRGVTVLFGGFGNGSQLGDTWEYNGAWQQRFPSASPGARIHHAMAYDSRRRVTVVFGGLNSANSPLGDTWEYDGSTWRLAAPPQSPSARHNHSMAYDSARGVVVLFGGQTNSGVLNETWEYDGISWRQASPTQSPSARVEMSIAYDSVRNAVMSFGGGRWGSTLTVFNETWNYKTTLTTRLPAERKVYVIVYDPILQNGDRLSTRLGWNSHALLSQQTIDFFKQTSGNRIHYSVVYTSVVTSGWPMKIDGFQYTEDTFPLLGPGRTPHTPDNVNYTAIANDPQFDICGKVNRGEIDEVWIYNGPYFGFWESTLAGPDAYWFNSPPVPGPIACNKMIPIMGPSPERGVAEAVHNFGHRMESTMTRVYGSWQQNSTAHNWNRFGLVKAQSPNYSYSGCGSIHYPPNGQSDYDYGHSSSAPTNCSDFASYPILGDPLLVAQSVTCASWACDHLQYLGYWFGHLPPNIGCGPDNVANDWWKYFASPALALMPKDGCWIRAYVPRVCRSGSSTR